MPGVHGTHVACSLALGGVDADVLGGDDAVDGVAVVVGEDGYVHLTQHGADAAGACRRIGEADSGSGTASSV